MKRCLALIALIALTLAAQAAPKPNVMIIVADDLGYHDVGFQGSKEIPTPHLDALAASGVRCTNGYVSHSFCSPTRAGLLTGRYQHRFGHETNPEWLPESTTAGLPLDQITLPQLLKDAGYATGHVGKWHLGAHPQFHPQKRGFTENFSILGGGHVYLPGGPGSQEYNIPLDRNGTGEAMKDYLTDQLGEEAEAYVKRHTDGQPWFLYYAFNAPHTPLQASPKWMSKVSHIAGKERQTYAAMIIAMDAAIGRVLSALDVTQQRDNTLIFFVSDNGGPDNSKRPNGVKFTDNTPLRGAKGDVWEGGARVPFLVSWPAQLKPSVYDQPVTALDFFTTSLAQAGASIPADRPIDGVDLIPHLNGSSTTAPHDILFWRTNGPTGNYGARMGNWKYVRMGSTAPQLFDLSTDIGETKDLAAEQPDILAQLQSKVDAWTKQTIAPVFAGPKGGKPKTKAKNAKKKAA
jgi:arylsulfatase A-like enzyme